MDLLIGTVVQICPYGANYSFDYLGHLDGEIAQVISRPRFVRGREQMVVMLKLSGGLQDDEFPCRALRPASLKESG